jgi:outer membrane receptor protein involved in Fe transport
VLGSVNLSFKVSDWLELSNRTGLTYKTESGRTFKDEAIYSAYSHSDPWSQGHMGVSSPYSGNSTNAMSSEINLTNDLLAKIDKKFGDFTTKVILGTSLYSSNINFIGIAASALVIPNFYNISNRVGEPGVGQSTLQRASIGAFGDATIGYKNYAFLHLSARNDWDSRLTAENRSFFYPAVDGSVILSDIMPSMTESDILSFLKVRGGWSKTGQIALANWYATTPSFIPGAGYPYGSNAGFRLSGTLSNPNLKPEMTNSYEVGVETSFLKGKIEFTVDAYKSNTVDQTIPASISSATGYMSAYINAGELESQGIETDLKLNKIINSGGFAWNLAVNYSYRTNKVISIYPGLNELPVNDGTAYGAARSVSYAVVGEQFPALRITDVLRDPDGRIIVDKMTGLPTKNPALVLAGHGDPNHLLGISNNFSFKGVSLSVVADYRGGNMILNDVGNALDFTGVSEHSALNGRQPFVIPNSVVKNADGSFTPNTDVLVTDAGRAFWVNSDYHTTDKAYLTSAAFWKLREVSLAYEIPVKKIPALKFMQAAQISFVGRDLFLFRPKTNVWSDPEFNSNAATSNALGYTDEDQTPTTRVYGFSVKLTF